MFGLKDYRGTELEVGQKVAFNLSGGVAYGEIVSIAMGKRYGRPKPIIKVKQLAPSLGEKNSTVGNEKNLLVLNEKSENLDKDFYFQT